MNKECIQCNETFSKPRTTSKHYWNTKRKFCSRPCKKLWQKGRPMKNSGQFQKGNQVPDWVRRKNIAATTGERNHFWKGDKASYFAIHMWLKTHFGKAENCEYEFCRYPRTNSAGRTLKKPKSFEYALRKGFRHSHKRENYIQLCSSCHKYYDNGSLMLSRDTDRF